MVRRPSAEPQERWTTVVVDTSPEFRIQTAEAGAKRLDAVLLTHDHADQCHGLDDIRAFAIRQRQRIDVWMDEATRAAVMRRFGYIFEGEGMYPPIADLNDPIPAHGDALERGRTFRTDPDRHLRPGSRRGEKRGLSLWRRCLFQRCRRSPAESSVPALRRAGCVDRRRSAPDAAPHPLQPRPGADAGSRG